LNYKTSDTILQQIKLTLPVWLENWTEFIVSTSNPKTWKNRNSVTKLFVHLMDGVTVNMLLNYDTQTTTSCSGSVTVRWRIIPEHNATALLKLHHE